MGVKWTYIFKGKHKVDGNSTEPLPDDVKARWEASLEPAYDMFVAGVARNRNMDERLVRKTEALCFTAQDAVSNGLADTLGTLDDAVAAFAADLSTPEDDGEDDMSKDKSAAELAAEQQMTTIDTARAEGLIQGKADGAKEGAATERARTKDILGCEEAKGRGKLASHLAFNTDMTVADAKAILAETPAEVAAGTKNPLENAMSRIKNPAVGADADGDQTEGQEAVALATGIVAAYRGKPSAGARQQH
jgi:ClpP class serine protease